MIRAGVGARSRRASAAAWLVAAAASVIAARAAGATPSPPIELAAIAPADDVRRCVLLGARGEAYEPDGNGRWVQRLPSTTAGALVAASRLDGVGVSALGTNAIGTSVIVALADGVVYRLAPNGWTSLRLKQRGKAVLGTGERAVAAVGRHLFALDAAAVLAGAEPSRLAMAPAPIIAIATGATGTVVATERGVFRLAGGRFVALPALAARGAEPARLRLISDRWAYSDRGAIELGRGVLTAWPSDFAVVAAASGPADALAAIGTTAAGVELVTVRAGRLTRATVGVTGAPIGVAVDRAGRTLVALADGQVALRESPQAAWTTTQVAQELPAAHPGAPPATSPTISPAILP